MLKQEKRVLLHHGCFLYLGVSPRPRLPSTRRQGAERQDPQLVVISRRCEHKLAWKAVSWGVCISGKVWW